MSILPSGLQKKHTRLSVLMFITAVVTIIFSPWGYLSGLENGPNLAYAEQSDRNHDGYVNLDDVEIFASKRLKKDWQDIDWCRWLEDGYRNKNSILYRNKQHLDDLFDFIREWFQCGQEPQEPVDPLAVENANDYPTRLALGPEGKVYVSDPKVGSIFIYDTSLQLTGELKGLDSPVGVAVDSAGFIYVGNCIRGMVEKYSPLGELVGMFGEGMIRSPIDLTLDQDENLYVADNKSNLVWVYDPNGALLRTIRRGGLKSPTAVEVAYYYDGTGQLTGKLFVADKKNYLVKVFDLQGNLLRSFGGFPEKSGWFKPTWNWQGKFISLQSLAMDADGNLHALDIYMNKVQILDPVTGAYIADYGEYGTGAGQLKLPLDIIINDTGDVIVANFGNKRVELIATTP